MSVLTTHRFTVEEYHRMAETGLLKPDARVGLLDGQIIAQTYDRGAKLPAYGRAGIQEFWIINLPERSIEVYREPHYLGYNSKSVLREKDQARPQAFPDVAIDVHALLRQTT